MSQRCTSCGAEASGKFCSACGAPLTPRACPTCGATAAAEARFCTACGRPLDGRRADRKAAAGGGPGSGGRWLGLAAVGVVAVGLAVALLARGPVGASRSAAAAPAPAAVRPPDLSAMTPREAFDRLFNRVMAAAEQGDTAEVARFAPMALLAYGNLPARDADARYHAAMLRLHSGDVSGAAALADTILTESPRHLFGYAIRMTVAKFDRRATDLRRSEADLLAAWDAEMAAGRPEYADHRTMLDGLAAEARAAAGQR